MKKKKEKQHNVTVKLIPRLGLRSTSIINNNFPNNPFSIYTQMYKQMCTHTFTLNVGYILP